MNIVLLGDFFQLLPIAGLLLFISDLEHTIDIASYNDYYAFNYTIELTRLMRQQGNLQLVFRRALEGLRNNILTYLEQQVLATRIASILPTRERQSFDDTTRIYFTNGNVRNFNKQQLTALNTPVVRLKAKYNNKNVGQRALADECSRLEAEIEVSIGYKIMLLKNVQTEAGLVNSATRFLYNLEWLLGTTRNPRETLPYYLIIRIKKTDYNRLQLQEVGANVIIPIFCNKRPFYRGGNKHYRKQFPIRVVFVITVYKA